MQYPLICLYMWKKEVLSYIFCFQKYKYYFENVKIVSTIIMVERKKEKFQAEV